MVSAKYTDADVERAHAALFGVGTFEERIAKLIAAVREECAVKCDALEAEFTAAYEHETDRERNNDQRCMAGAFAQAAAIIRGLP